MSNVRRISNYRPSQEAVERRVASLDDGYMRLATSISRLKPRLKMAGREHQVFDAVIDCTYGWNKSEDKVTNTYLAEMTGLDDSDVASALNVLAERKVITLRKIGGFKLVSVNVNIDQWQLNKTVKTPPRMLGETAHNVGRKKVSSWAKPPDTKDSLTKDNHKTPHTPQGDEIDESKIQDCWNEIAVKKNFVTSLGLADSIKRHLRRNFTAYLKHCKKIKKDQPKSITDFSCTYLARGFAGWATGHHSGENDRKWRADIEFATRKSTFEKIFYSGD